MTRKPIKPWGLDDEKRMILDPTSWPLIFLPVKKTYGTGEMPNFGMVLDEQPREPIKVYKMRRTDTGPLEVFLTFPTVDEFLAAGWRVD